MRFIASVNKETDIFCLRIMFEGKNEGFDSILLGETSLKNGFLRKIEFIESYLLHKIVGHAS